MNRALNIESQINSEQLPVIFTAFFQEVNTEKGASVRISIDDEQFGDLVNDNAYENDNYRYHDIFHLTFATLLRWSPCTRSMMKRKRKSKPIIDEVEDGARAAITEEAISLILFSEAKKKRFFKDDQTVDPVLLDIIKSMTDSFEVKDRTRDEWEQAIMLGYKMFCLLVQNKGGKVQFDAKNQTVEYCR